MWSFRNFFQFSTIPLRESREPRSEKEFRRFRKEFDTVYKSETGLRFIGRNVCLKDESTLNDRKDRWSETRCDRCDNNEFIEGTTTTLFLEDLTTSWTRKKIIYFLIFTIKSNQKPVHLCYTNVHRIKNLCIFVISTCNNYNTVIRYIKYNILYYIIRYNKVIRVY